MVKFVKTEAERSETILNNESRVSGYKDSGSS